MCRPEPPPSDSPYPGRGSKRLTRASRASGCQPPTTVRDTTHHRLPTHPRTPPGRARRARAPGGARAPGTGNQESGRRVSPGHPGRRARARRSGRVRGRYGPVAPGPWDVRRSVSAGRDLSAEPGNRTAMCEGRPVTRRRGATGEAGARGSRALRSHGSAGRTGRCRGTVAGGPAAEPARPGARPPPKRPAAEPAAAGLSVRVPRARAARGAPRPVAAPARTAAPRPPHLEQPDRPLSQVRVEPRHELRGQ